MVRYQDLQRRCLGGKGQWDIQIGVDTSLKASLLRPDSGTTRLERHYPSFTIPQKPTVQAISRLYGNCLKANGHQAALFTMAVMVGTRGFRPSAWQPETYRRRC